MAISLATRSLPLTQRAAIAPWILARPNPGHGHRAPASPLQRSSAAPADRSPRGCAPSPAASTSSSSGVSARRPSSP
eukprot:11755099-Alexandrium_andersonii.AAC.1